MADHLGSTTRRARLLMLSAVFVGAIAVARAAPLPELRELGAAGAARPGVLSAFPEGGTDGPCGTRPGSVGGVLRLHQARPLSIPLPTPNSTDAGSIAVLEDDGTFFYPDKNGDAHVDLAAVTNAFYRTHGDDYDVLAVYLSSGLTDYLGSPTALASEFGIRNAIRGIGLDTFDYGAGFGSPARLSAVLSMNGLQKYNDNPDSSTAPDSNSPLDFLAHELGHRWLAYVLVDSAGSPSPALLGRDFQHWSFFFDSDSSYLEGNDWAQVDADSFLTDGVTNAYGTLDLYLMGLLPAAAIDSFFVVNDPTAFDPPVSFVSGSGPQLGVGCRGRATWWKLTDVQAVHGPRIPDATAAPHAFRMAVILVTARGNAASAADLAKLEAVRSRFGPRFAASTRGLGAMDLSLASRAGRVCIAHEPLRDTEDALAARAIGCRASIAQAGIPIALDPASIAALWRPAGGGPWTTIPLAPAGADSFAGSLPALPAGGGAEYYLVAASDSVGLAAADPPGGASAPHAYRVGPDLTAPVIAHSPVRDQSRARLPQTLLARVTDNLGVDSVWVEYAVDGGPPRSAAATPAGRDSFAVSLGAGLLEGQRLAYRFVARDRAAAGNLAWSNIAYDSLAVGLDWADDFENGPAGYFHGSQWWSYRDAWHLTQEDASPAGGTAWKCGAEGPGDYPPHLDACLYTPLITGLPPGTLLRFDHRYDLEQADATRAWDGARIEAQVGGGDWQVLAPVDGYSHAFIANSNPFQRGAPCWSGSSGGWRTETVDLSALAPGPARIRFRMLADEFLGGAGWFVDRVRLQLPGTANVPAAAGALAIGRPWPNPAHGELRLSLSLPRAAAGDWSLYDVAGRRVARLWRGTAPAGAFEIRAPLGTAPAGLYFARLVLDGREAGRARVAVVR